MEGRRIEFLDGLRGIAILLVIMVHAYVAWPDLVPYGDRFSSFPVFKYGFLGVQLFFLISGFVILMSLEKNQNFYSFIYKRWVRLFPAMFIATLIAYLGGTFLYDSPSGNVQLSSVIPGLLFIEPNWIRIVTGIKINSLDGAFWSLFVEMKFYVIFGILYFCLGKMKAIVGLILLFVLSLFFFEFQVKYLVSITEILSFRHFGWFAGGCLAYLFYSNKQTKYLLLSISIAGVEFFTFKYDLLALFFSCVFILAIFILPVYFEKIRIIFTNRFFLFFGFISYPLYLIHQNIMIALIVELNKSFSPIPYILLPVIPVMILCLIAFLIADRLEPFIRELIQGKLGNVRRLKVYLFAKF